MEHGDSHDAHDAHAAHAPAGHEQEHRGALEKFILPLVVPAVAGLALFAVILAVSQILLAVGGDTATPIALLIALIVLLGCSAIASAKRVTRGQIMASVAVPALVLGVAGIGARAYRVNHHEKKSEAGTQAAIPPQITTDDKFSVTSYTVQANTPIDIPVKNEGAAIHNMHILGVNDEVTGKEPTTPGLVNPGETSDLKFTIATPGTYKFQCDVHPTVMIGQITVTPGGAGGAAASAGGAAGTGGNTLAETTTDNKFSATTFSIDHGQKVTMTVTNKGTALHNWDVLDTTGKTPLNGADGAPIKTDFVNGGESKSVTFQIDTPGTYNFQCDVHPTEMKGTLVVK
jgi:plastocyanin